MGRSRTPNPRVLAVLKMPEDDVPRFIVLAIAIADATGGNSWFPDAGPPLARLRAAIQALSDAQTATLSQKAATSARDEKRNAANRLLHEARALPARVFAADDGPVSGSAEVVAPREGDRAVYEFAHSIDGAKTWIVHAGQRKSTLVIHGLTPGSTVWFRYRAGTDAMGDWSDPISLIIR